MTASPPAAPGMPSELREVVKASLPSIAIAIEEWLFNGAADDQAASDIADLIRPAFEAKDAKADRLAESVGRLSVQLDAAEAKLAQAVEALDDAAENIEHWGSYASSYLQDKHGLKDDIASARSASAAARGET